MPLYLYEAVDSSGRKIRESATYSDESALKSSLLILLMRSVVGFIVISMLIVIFSINEIPI